MSNKNAKFEVLHFRKYLKLKAQLFQFSKVLKLSLRLKFQKPILRGRKDMRASKTR